MMIWQSDVTGCDRLANLFNSGQLLLGDLSLPSLKDGDSLLFYFQVFH